MSKTRKFLHAVGIIFFSSILASALGYVLKIILARNLTLSEFGLFSAVFAFVSLFVSFSDMGMGIAAVKYIAEFNVEKKYEQSKNALLYLFFFQFVFLAVIFLAIALFAPTLGRTYFQDTSATKILLILLAAFFLYVVETFFATAFYGFKKITFLSAIPIIKQSLLLVALLIFFSLGWGVVAPAYAYLAAFLIAPLAYLVMFKRTFPDFLSVKFSWDASLAKKIAGAGASIFANGIAANVLTSAGILLLTHFRSLSEVALYNIAFSLVTLVRQAPRALAVVLLPVSSELYAEKNPEFALGLRKLYIYSIAAIIPLIAGVAYFAPLILTILFGDEYVSAALVLRILACGAIPVALALINESIFRGIGKPHTYAIFYALGAAFGIIASVILIPWYGISGAAFGYLGAMLIIAVISLVVLSKELTIKIPFGAWVKTICAGAIFLLSLEVAKKILDSIVSIPELFQAIVLVCVACSIYVLVLLRMRVVTLKELKKIIASVL